MQTTRPVRGRLTVALLAALALTATVVVPTGVSWDQPMLTSAPAGPSVSPAATAVDPAVTAALRTSATAPVIVRFGAVRPADAIATIVDTGGQVTADLPIVNGLAATVSLETVQRLRDAGVAAISFDGPVSLAHGSSTDPVAPDTSVRRTVGADSLHRSRIDGRGVGIALIDTGSNEVDELRRRVVGGVDLTADGDLLDRFGHGTFVAGVAAGSTYGIAPGAHVVPVKIAGEDGSSDVSHVLAAMQWVVSFRDAYDIGVVNLSLGTDSQQDWRIDPMNYAVERAWEAGIVVVVSGSNLGPDSGSVTKPADDPWVIAVGATDSEGTWKRNDDTVADYSGRGPTRSGGLAKPDLVAPGSHLLGARAAGSTIDANNPDARYGTDFLQGSGTSFSAAVVSGAVALLRDAHPDWTPDQIKGALLATAATGPVGDPNVDGRGALDVAAAAALDDPPLANQGLARSDASGTLAASRGTLEIAITDTTEQVVETTTCVEKLLRGGLFSTLKCTVEETVEVVETVLRVLDDTSEYTAQNQLFDAEAFVDDPWTEASWYGNQWYGNQWYGNQWYGNQWYGNQWYGNQWYSEDYG